MSNYTKSTNFTAKDSLPTGDTNKVIRGSEFDTEFNAIQTAVGTKADLAGPTFTGTATFDGITATGTVNFTGGSVTTNIDGGTIDGVTIGGTTAGAGTFSSLTATTADINAGTVDNTVIGGSTPAAGTFSSLTATTANIDGGNIDGTVIGASSTAAISGTTGTFSGAVTGSNLNVANWDTAYGWGDHGVEGYLTSVTFSDIDAGAITTSGETFANSDTQIPTNAAVRNWVLTTYPTIVEQNNLTLNVTWATVPDAYISESSVTQHEAALSISTSQLAGGLSLSDITDVTATATEVNYTDGVTSNIQTQLDSKVGANYTGDVDITGELLVDSYNETFKRVTSASNATTVNCENANVFEHVLTENTTFTFSNPPASGTPVVTGYQLGSAAYDSKSFSVASQEAAPSGIAFNTNGTKMFVVGYNGDEVNEYDLTTSFDVSTSTYSQTFSVSAQATEPTGITFNSDGTKMFILDISGLDVNEYVLTTGFDISTASYSQNFSVSAQEANPQGISFNTDGTKMFVVGLTGDDVNEYTLTTGFDVSTASYSQNFSVASQETSPTDVQFNADGTKMYIIGLVGDDVNEYTLTTGFDVSTASYSQNFSVASQETNPYGLAFSADGTKMFVVGSGTTVYQYSTSTSVLNDSTAYAMSLKVVQDSGASGYTVTWPTSVDWPAATAPTLTATASAVDQFVFYTYDGGTTWYGFTAGQALG